MWGTIGTLVAVAVVGKVVEGMASAMFNGDDDGDSDNNHKFETRIKQERLRNRLSQKRLAEKVGVSQRYISQIERGHISTIDNNIARKLAKAINVKEKDLFE